MDALIIITGSTGHLRTQKSQLMPRKISRMFMFGVPFQVKGSLAPFFDGTMTAQSYLAMLQHQLLPLLQQQDKTEGLYFQQDGEPAHYATLV